MSWNARKLWQFALLVISTHQFVHLYTVSLIHLIRVATLPCRTSMSDNKWHSQTNVVIDDKSQGSVATHLRCGETFNSFFYRFIAESASEKIFTSPDSTFSTTFFKWPNLTWQYESFMPDCFTHFVNMAISGNKYFHKVMQQQMQGVVGSLITAFL